MNAAEILAKVDRAEEVMATETRDYITNYAVSCDGPCGSPIVGRTLEVRGIDAKGRVRYTHHFCGVCRSAAPR